MWANVYPELSEGKAGAYGAATSRAEAHVLRLSMIYALLDRSAVIRVDHLLAALALWDYSAASARWIFGTRSVEGDAEKLLNALRASEDGLDRTAIIADVFGRHKPKES